MVIILPLFGFTLVFAEAGASLAGQQVQPATQILDSFRDHMGHARGNLEPARNADET